MNKYVLGTVCAASVFASCTNEELVKSGNVQQGVDAKQIEVLLSAKFAEDAEAESRMVLEGNEYAWVKGDMVGACYVGPRTGKVVNTISTNYPFNLTEEPTQPVKTADFTTNTTVYEGQYVFYHQYDGTMVATENSKFNVVFPSVQSIDPANINKSVAENNLFVSPIIDVEGIKYQDVNTIPVQFVPVYSTLEIKIKNNVKNGKAVKVNKVEVVGDNITPAKSNFDFASKFTTSTAKAAAIQTAVDEMNEQYNLLTSAKGGEDDIISAVIKGSDLTVNYGAEKSIKVLIPSGIYDIVKPGSGNDLSIEKFVVYTDQGKFEITADQTTSEKVEKNDIEFKHRTLRSLTTELTGEGTVVNEFTINNIDDWNAAVDYAEHFNNKVEFKLNADLEVKTLPTCAVYVTGSNKLIIPEGATVTMVKDSYFKNVINKGTINLTENVRILNITNESKGIINVAKTETIQSPTSVSFDLGEKDEDLTPGVANLENKGVININGVVNISNQWTNKADEPKYKGTINVAKDAKLVSTSFANEATINVYGTVDVINKLTNNKGYIYMFTETAKFVGEANTITNSGIISLNAIKDIFRSKNNEQVFSSFVKTEGVGCVMVSVKPTDFQGTNLPSIEEVNGVTLSGNWTNKTIDAMNDKWNTSKNSISCQYWQDATIDVAEMDGNEFSKVERLFILGNTSLTNSSVSSVDLILPTKAENKYLWVYYESDFTVGKYVRLGKAGKNYPYIFVSGKMNNNGEVRGQIEVGIGTTNAAVYTNNSGAKTICASASNTYDDLILYGTFINKSAETDVVLKSVIFKTPESTFTGKYTTKNN